MTPRLSVVVPMYREAERIGATVATLASWLDGREDVELVFVDDGSDDRTVAVLRDALAAWRLDRASRVVALERNRGKGAAVREGVLAARGLLVGFVDADLSLDPVEIDRAAEVLRSAGAAAVVGRRVVDHAHQPVLRRLASLSFRAAVAAVAPTGVRDSQCALKLFTQPVARMLFEPLTTDGFAFDVEVLLRAKQARVGVVQLPVTWQHQPGSRVRPVRDGLKMLREVLAARRAVVATPAAGRVAVGHTAAA